MGLQRRDKSGVNAPVSTFTSIRTTTRFRDKVRCIVTVLFKEGVARACVCTAGLTHA